MNLVETLSAKVQEQAEEIQRLRDENRRLKGEQVKPTFKPKKQAPFKINQIKIFKVDAHLLPDDVQF
jgi:hypothetical protein